MPVQRVLILSSQTLFAESLVALLEHEGYPVLGVQPFDDTALARIAAEQPSIVVLDARGAPPAAATALLECVDDIRVVQVSLDSAVIDMYRRRQSVATAHGFLELITVEDTDGPREEGAGDAAAAKTSGAAKF